MTTRRFIILKAYGELGLAEYNFDLSAEELTTARHMLDMMMAEWEMRVALGYYMPSNPDESDLDDETGLSQGVIKAVWTNLALALAPGLGKTPSPLTMVSAKNGKDAVMARYATIPRLQYSGNLPVGSGNKPLPGLGGFFRPRRYLTTTPNGDTLDDSQGSPFSIS